MTHTLLLAFYHFSIIFCHFLSLSGCLMSLVVFFLSPSLAFSLLLSLSLSLTHTHTHTRTHALTHTPMGSWKTPGLLSFTSHSTHIFLLLSYLSKRMTCTCVYKYVCVYI